MTEPEEDILTEPEEDILTEEPGVLTEELEEGILTEELDVESPYDYVDTRLTQYSPLRSKINHKLKKTVVKNIPSKKKVIIKPTRYSEKLEEQKVFVESLNNYFSRPFKGIIDIKNKNINSGCYNCAFDGDDDNDNDDENEITYTKKKRKKKKHGKCSNNVDVVINKTTDCKKEKKEKKEEGEETQSETSCGFKVLSLDNLIDNEID